MNTLLFSRLESDKFYCHVQNSKKKKNLIYYFIFFSVFCSLLSIFAVGKKTAHSAKWKTTYTQCVLLISNFCATKNNMLGIFSVNQKKKKKHCVRLRYNQNVINNCYKKTKWDENRYNFSLKSFLGKQVLHFKSK